MGKFILILNFILAFFVSIVDATFSSGAANDDDTPRDAWWLRWLKYISIILVPALVLGGAIFFVGMSPRYDTNASMKFRFWLGAGIGGGLGLIYVLRCIIRKVDP